MVYITDYKEEKSCVYKNEEYLVRDNGAVLRKTQEGKRKRKHDNEWTFGTKNYDNGYSYFFGSGHRIHQIVATAFYGDRPSKEYIVDHIDTNRQNNRADNLRWITREENVLDNELTRRKIEYVTGVSAEEFLQDPSKYRSSFGKQNVSYMRPVNEAEAIAYSINIEKLGNATRPPLYQNSSKLGNWIYNIRDPYVKHQQWENEQKNWRARTEFVCCPKEMTKEPIANYLKSLSPGKVFSKCKDENSAIVSYATEGIKSIIVVITTNFPDKPLAVVRIKFENDQYVHTYLGEFYSKDDIKKAFAVERDLEWIN